MVFSFSFITYCAAFQITFYIAGGLRAAAVFLRNLKIATVAVSLGGVETLVEHPALMTHRVLSPEARAELGIDDGMIRMSVGIEDEDDLVADIRSALNCIGEDVSVGEKRPAECSVSNGLNGTEKRLKAECNS